MKNKLKVLYLTNGQRVPEDICLLNKNYELEMMLLNQTTPDVIEAGSSEESTLETLSQMKTAPKKASKRESQLNA